MKGIRPVSLCPNRMGRIVLSALEEILGRSELHALLRSASLVEYIDPPAERDLAMPFGHLAALQSALEDIYGTRAGRGLALRAGRACFKYGLHEFGPQLGATAPAFRLLPLPAKLESGGQALASFLNEGLDLKATLEKDRRSLSWNMGNCPLCWGRRLDGPGCHLAVGLLQEACYWVSGGKIFQVAETRCIAQGDSACTIVIDRQPIG
jgi:predicted hydrocarbon binding protein